MEHLEGTHNFGVVGLLLALRIVKVSIETVMKHLQLLLVEHADHFFTDPGIATSDSHERLIGEASLFQLIENALHFHINYILLN